MPSLMPGMPGTKEAYGISVIRGDFIKIPLERSRDTI
jgi:hypothetical protein